MYSRALRSSRMRFIAHRVHTTSVDPAIIEVKQSAGGDGVINSFVAEPSLVQNSNIRRSNSHRIFIDLANEPEKRLIGLAKFRSFHIGQHARHELTIIQQFRCDRSVRFCSKRTLIEARRVRRDKFANAW